MVCKIGGERVYLWRGVDDEGVVLDLVVQKRRDTGAALKLLRRLLRNQDVESAEALPFIADDVLIDFDDPRSVASLEILATFAQSTQVILFTHHDSVLEAAKKLEGRGEAVVVRLP